MSNRLNHWRAILKHFDKRPAERGIRVTGLRRVKLKEIDDKLAKKDGASSSTEAKAYWSKQGFRADDELWLVGFDLVK